MGQGTSLTGGVHEDVRHSSSHEYLLQEKRAEKVAARGQQKIDSHEEIRRKAFTRDSAGLMPEKEQREVARLKLQRLQESIEQGTRWWNDWFERMDSELNSQRARPIPMHKRFRANPTLAARGEWFQLNGNLIHDAANDTSAGVSIDDQSNSPYFSDYSESSYSELPTSSERSSGKIEDADWCNPPDRRQLRKTAACDESEQMITDPDVSKVIETSKPVIGGDTAAINDVHAGKSTNGPSCAEQSSSEDDVMDWCNRRYLCKPNERKQVSEHTESQQEGVNLIKDRDTEDHQSTRGNVTALTDDSQNGQTTDEPPHREQSYEEIERRQWYEKSYMHEIEHLPAKQRCRQTSTPAGTVS
ncbi:hypothetical protein E8E12_005901 [Didymella heteroderae]|uniref:Uncharacterized protein n=1 Tax=Didymella heteroderae TaxID=1769908 RepID=A0A9P4WND7_9PLEO|nr:hypothetical protein E8E12_005901 [Didymella heteroderae]